jgi:reactive chlorine resistance protein C
MDDLIGVVALVANHSSLRTDLIAVVGLGLLRYGLVLLLLTIGAFKFFAFEAEGIRPLVSEHPLLAWLYDVLEVRATSSLFGVFEIGTGVLIATRRWTPRLSGWASLAASGLFLVTLSFLFTTPGALLPTSPFNQFLLKDVVLLGAALFTAAEALSADSRVPYDVAVAVPDRQLH